jgi:geranylgeranyl diphosphate synthase, type I
MTLTGVRRGTTSGPRELDGEGLDAVEDLLRRRIDDHVATLEAVGGELRDVSAAVRDAAEGGKRLRAAFCLWGARAGAGGVLPAGAVEAGAALELFHLAALVHDDLMDHSDARRGRPTVHRRFADQHVTESRLGDAEQHGAAVAILAGDLCLTWSDDLLAEAVGVSAPGTGPASRAVWTQMRDQVLAGQYLDVLGQTRRSLGPDEVRRVLRYKSASYTVEHPLLLGASLAGAAPALLRRLSAFGLHVGEAFQLRDDLLGVFGSPEVTGKPTLDDLREGKRTLLVAFAEEQADADQLAVLRGRLGHPALDEQGAREVREVMAHTGAVARVEERIGELVGSASAALADMRIDERSRLALAALTDACAWRTA